MTRRILRVVVFFVVAPVGIAAYGQTRKVSTASNSDSDLKRVIIASSIASYSGSCPCPYNTDRAGRKCGKRSAYSRLGGGAPLCYDSDVTAKMVAAYRAARTK
jgi:hypothetical protein